MPSMKSYTNVNLPPTMSGSSHMSNYRQGESHPMMNVSGSLFAKVLSVNWFDRTISCVGYGNQSGAGPWYDVPLLSPILTQSEGIHWLPTVTDTNGDNPRLMSDITGELDAMAVIDFIGGDALRPVCLGFVSVGPHEFAFGEPGTKIERHASGIYSRTTAEGVHEMSYPDGTYFRVAPESSGDQLDNLNGQNSRYADTRPWAIDQTNPNIVTLSHVTGTKTTIRQDGSMQVLSLAGAEISLDVDGSMALKSPSGAAISFGVDGSLKLLSPSGTGIIFSADGSLSLSSSGGASIVFATDGSLSIQAQSGSSGGALTINNINFLTHTHQYTQANTSTDSGGSPSHTHGVGNSISTTGAAQ